MDVFFSGTFVIQRNELLETLHFECFVFLIKGALLIHGKHFT